MGLISRLFGMLFSKQANDKPVPGNDYVLKWEKDRNKRIIAAEGRLKEFIVSSIKAKNTLPFTWESGNDEAFLTFEDENESSAEKFEDLQEYIIDKLDIPDAGEFSMTGIGHLYISDNFVRAKYSSTMKEVLDYNEKTDEVMYKEAEQDSGDRILFPL